MNSELILRFAQKKDLKEIIRLCELHANYEQSDYNPKQKKEQLSNYLFSDIPSLYCLVVEKDVELIGYATYMKQFSTWDASFYVYMDCLFLTENARGYGIGEKLMERIKQETKNLNCTLIQWQTPKFNTRAMKFYDRIGGNSKTKERYFLNI